MRGIWAMLGLDAGEVANTVTVTVEDAQRHQAIASDAASMTIAPNEANQLASIPEEETAKRPTGRMVGILRRNFGTYSGSIYTSATATGRRAMSRFPAQSTNARNMVEMLKACLPKPYPLHKLE